MRTTITFDETLLAQARMLCGINDRSALLREALTALMQRESTPCQARLGGSTRFAGNSASPRRPGWRHPYQLMPGHPPRAKT